MDEGTVRKLEDEVDTSPLLQYCLAQERVVVVD
jgi:hypothetical protein